MARKNLMPAPTRGGVLPKVIGSLVAMAVLVMVVKHPSEAATCAKALISGVGTIIDGIASFVRQVG
jgi:hypothetical protein